MRSFDKQTAFLVLAILFAAIGLPYLALQSASGQGAKQQRRSRTLQNPLNGDRAYRALQTICQIGPRISGTSGMVKQQDMLRSHFEKLGATVSMQRFNVRHPQTGNATELANLIATWHPKRRQRILLCAHYDTRPYPDRDPDPAKRKGVFIGANDGASGVAVLAELGRFMPNLKSKYGVDFVLFDGEELVYQEDRDPYFLGSTHFAQQYRANKPDHRYRYAILLDMVGDKDLNILQERNSLSWPSSRPLVLSLWATARRLGVYEFISQPGHEIKDDHLPLHNIAGIPACDIIDFDYGPPRRGYWHTTEDTPDKCSGDSLAKVGWVVLKWIQDQR